MKKPLCLLLLIIIVFLGIPMMVSALGLDVAVQAGGGGAMGTTDDDNKSGELRWAAGGGIVFDLYVFEMNNLGFGISSGADYINLHYYGFAENVPTPPPLPLLYTGALLLWFSVGRAEASGLYRSFEHSSASN